MPMSEAGRQALSERMKAKRAAGFNPRRIYLERLQREGVMPTKRVWKCANCPRQFDTAQRWYVHRNYTKLKEGAPHELANIVPKLPRGGAAHHNAWHHKRQHDSTEAIARRSGIIEQPALPQHSTPTDYDNVIADLLVRIAQLQSLVDQLRSLQGS